MPNTTISLSQFAHDHRDVFGHLGYVLGKPVENGLVFGLLRKRHRLQLIDSLSEIVEFIFFVLTFSFCVDLFYSFLKLSDLLLQLCPKLYQLLLFHLSCFCLLRCLLFGLFFQYLLYLNGKVLNLLFPGLQFFICLAYFVLYFLLLCFDLLHLLSLFITFLF